jgi:hypothetical protein
VPAAKIDLHVDGDERGARAVHFDPGGIAESGAILDLKLEELSDRLAVLPRWKFECPRFPETFGGGIHQCQEPVPRLSVKTFVFPQAARFRFFLRQLLYVAHFGFAFLNEILLIKTVAGFSPHCLTLPA